MKSLLSIIVLTIILLSGLPTAFGFSLLRGKPQSVNRWPYGFGVHYNYDNGGSSWNYDSHLKQGGFRNHPGRLWQFRHSGWFQPGCKLRGKRSMFSLVRFLVTTQPMGSGGGTQPPGSIPGRPSSLLRCLRYHTPPVWPGS